MKASVMIRFLLTCVVASLVSVCHANEPAQVINLWPGNAPGEKGNIGEERNMSKPNDHMTAKKPVVRLGNVSKPTISIFRPPTTNDIGTAVLVFPGGGYSIVAMDIEGTEVCEWLNSLGVTAVLLKYRVPRREGLEKHAAPLQDAQRALSLIRHRATDLGINPKKIGVLGFSAGGHLAASLSTSAEKRTYDTVEAADTDTCRPDFALLIYPAYLTLTNNLEKLSPEVAVTSKHPPTFMAMAQDDPVHMENVLAYALALQQAKVPVELHLYPKGGHGYGLRKTGNPTATWPDRAADWLRYQSLLPKK